MNMFSDDGGIWLRYKNGPGRSGSQMVAGASGCSSGAGASGSASEIDCLRLRFKTDRDGPGPGWRYRSLRLLVGCRSLRLRL